MFNESANIKKSFIYNIHPVLKILTFVFFIVMIFLPLGFFAQTILLIIIISIFFIARIRFKTFWNILKSIIFLFAILFIVNWIIYKEPIAVSDQNFSLYIGQTNYINGPIAYNKNGIYISNIWGGNIGIDNSLIFTNQLNQTQIDEIIRQNHGTQTGLNWINSQDSFMYNNIKINVLKIDNVKDTYIMYQTKWWSLSPIAIQLALYISIKVFLMILISTILTQTTNSSELTYAFERLLSPLKIFNLPVAEASMIIAIALRFVPSLLSEANRIQDAQASRGIDAKNGGISQKFKSIISLIIPLFSIAFKKGDELANAMESRAYNPRYARTKYRKYYLYIWDYIMYFLLCCLFGFFIAITIFPTLFTPYGIFEISTLI